MNTKPTNPKDAIGSKKVAPHYVPAHFLMGTALAMQEGAIKYGAHNYRVSGVRTSIYYDAALRHLMAYWEGQDIDPDSGLPHLVKAAACLCILLDAQANNKLNDDRPPAMADANWVAGYNEKAAKLISSLPPAVEPYTEKGYRQTELFREVNPPAMNAYEMWQRINDQTSESFYPEQNDFKDVNPKKSETISHG